MAPPTDSSALLSKGGGGAGQGVSVTSTSEEALPDGDDHGGFVSLDRGPEREGGVDGGAERFEDQERRELRAKVEGMQEALGQIQEMVQVRFRIGALPPDITRTCSPHDAPPPFLLGFTRTASGSTRAASVLPVAGGVHEGGGRTAPKGSEGGRGKGRGAAGKTVGIRGEKGARDAGRSNRGATLSCLTGK